MYALKSKSMSEMHFPVIWRSKFTDLAGSKKIQSLGKNGCRQKCFNKNLMIACAHWVFCTVNKEDIKITHFS